MRCSHHCGPATSLEQQLLPRFVHERQIKTGLAYYWAPLTRDRKIPGCPKSVPLGSKWDAVVERAAMLNEQYNIWRLRRVKEDLGITKTGGFLSKVENR
jgi:hypothetical protein